MFSVWVKFDIDMVRVRTQSPIRVKECAFMVGLGITHWVFDYAYYTLKKKTE